MHIIHPRREKREPEPRHGPDERRRPSGAGRVRRVRINHISLGAIEAGDEADGEDASAEIGDGPVQLVGAEKP